MANDITKPDPAPVLDLMEAFRRSKVMFAGVSLGVFDALSAGPMTSAAWPPPSQPMRTPSTAARCLRQPEPAEAARRTLRNTPAAQTYLTSTSPDRLTGYINYSNSVMWKLWANLEDAVREGTHRWKQTFGWDGPIFANLFHDDQAMREFLMGMHGYGLISSPQVVAAFDLSRFQCLVDLGGATGHLAIAACTRYPAMKGVVFDLPDRRAPGPRHGRRPAVAGRIEVVAGDFFTDPLPPGDIYAVGRILHDWTEEKIVKLLARIYEKLPPDGALLIAEKLLLEDKSGPRWAQMQSLNMLTCTEGKERTLGEYEALLKKVRLHPGPGLPAR